MTVPNKPMLLGSISLHCPQKWQFRDRGTSGLSDSKNECLDVYTQIERGRGMRERERGEPNASFMAQLLYVCKNTRRERKSKDEKRNVP